MAQFRFNYGEEIPYDQTAVAPPVDQGPPPPAPAPAPNADHSLEDLWAQIKPNSPIFDQGPPAPIPDQGPPAPVSDKVASYVKAKPDVAPADIGPPYGPPQPDPEAARLDRISKTKRNLALAQNLDLVGRSLAGLGKGSGVDTTKLGKVDTSASEGDVAEAQDALSAADRKFLEQSNIVVPPNMTYSRLQKLLPTVANSLNTQAKTAASAKEKETSDALRKAAQDRLMGAATRPTEKMIEKDTEYDNTLKSIARIRSDKVKAAASVGPLEGRVNQALAQGGLAGPDASKLQAELGQLLSAYGKSISGAAISEAEMSRFQQQLPQLYHKGDTFDTLLDRFEEQTKASKASNRDVSSKQGYIWDRGSLVGGGPTAQTGGTQKFTLNGETYNIPADQAKAFLSDNPGAQKG